MTGSIRLLRQIQEVDLEILAIENEARSREDAIKKAREEVLRLQSEREAQEESFTEVDGIVKELNETIRVNNERIKKDEARLSEITSDKQLKALNKEIGAAKRAIKAAEERHQKVSPKFDETEGKLNDMASTIEEKTAEAERLASEIESMESEWTKAIEEKHGVRATVASEVNPSVLKRYETIKERRMGIGLVRVQDETCQGCYIHVPPQVYIKLMRGDDELISCPNCHRLLYFHDESAEEADE